jgi:hypothetical protein
MDLKLTARYRSAADLARHLQDQVNQGALLLPLPELETEIQQFQPVELRICFDETNSSVEAEVLQVIPNLGVAVSLKQPEKILALVEDVAPAEAAAPPEVSRTGERETEEVADVETGADLDDLRSDAADLDDIESFEELDDIESFEDLDDVPPLAAEEREGKKLGYRFERGAGPLSWSLDKLQREWPELSMADKVRVARYGKRPARTLVLKQHDKIFHAFLLQNAGITPDEVAVMAGMVSIDPAILRRLVGSQEWLRHTQIARNLVCHPKLTLPQVNKVLKHLNPEELRRLTRTGKVRASVKRLIIKKLEQRSFRR